MHPRYLCPLKGGKDIRCTLQRFFTFSTSCCIEALSVTKKNFFSSLSKPRRLLFWNVGGEFVLEKVFGFGGEVFAEETSEVLEAATSGEVKGHNTARGFERRYVDLLADFELGRYGH